MNMKCAKAIIVFFIFVLFGNCAYSFEGSIKVSAADARGTVIIGADDQKGYVTTPPVPPSAPYLNMYILEKEGNLHKLIRQNDDELSYFVFIEYKTQNRNKTMSVSGNFDDIPEDYSIILVDNGKNHDLREKGYVFDSNGDKFIDKKSTKIEKHKEKGFEYYDEIVLIGLLIIVIIVLVLKKHKKKVIK